MAIGARERKVEGQGFVQGEGFNKREREGERGRERWKVKDLKAQVRQLRFK